MSPTLMTTPTTLTTVTNPRYNQVASNPQIPAITKAGRAQLLNDVRALLNGGKVPQGKYDKIVGDSTAPKEGFTEVTKSIDTRIKDLKEDKCKLFENNPDGLNNSYASHINAAKQQINALREALRKFTEGIPPASRNEFEKNLITTVTEVLKNAKVPEKPDSYYRPITRAERNANKTPAGKPTLNTPDQCKDQPVTKPAISPASKKPDSTSESQTLKQIINSIPLISQEQKDATRKALESTGVPKIIKDSVNGGKEYWEKTGKQQLTNALDGLVKAGTIAVGIAIFILEFVGKTVTGQLVSNPQDTTETPSIASTAPTLSPNSNTSSVPTANSSNNSQTSNSAPTPVAATSTSTSESQQPISSAPFTGTIPNNQSNSNSEPFRGTISTKSAPFTRTISANPNVDPSTFIATGKLENFTVSGTLNNQPTQPPQLQQGMAQT